MRYPELFSRLATTSSRNEKIKLLEQADELAKKILLYTYHPFKHYYINKTVRLKTSVSVRCIDYTFFRLLDELSDRIFTGDDAISKVQQYISNLAYNDADIFQKILKKDLRCGISIKTINKALPGLIPEYNVMLAKQWDDSRYKSGLCMSLKLDGVRATYIDGVFRSRKGHQLYGLNHLIHALTDAGIKDPLDGELTIPGKSFQETSGLIRNFNVIPDAVFNVFDYTSRSNTPFKSRYEKLTMLIDSISSPNIELLRHVSVKNLEHIYSTFARALSSGYEGLVIKPWNYTYKYSRSWDWMKLKAKNSEDLSIIGVFEGQGKYAESLGGFIVDRQGVSVKVGSGFSDAERSQVWADVDAYMGKTIEVAYHEVTPDGSLRHPVYKGVRWDK